MERTIKKTDVWSLFMYIIIYSVAGFIIETNFGMITKGVIESRKSFLYGPFCAIYGIGAVTMISFLKNQKSLLKLFAFGAIIGAIVEFGMSFFCEKFFGVKWWDYSDQLLNIQGRTCLFYAVSWGLLAILLIKVVNPYIDKFIFSLKQRKNIFQIVTSLIIVFFIADAVVTGYTLKVFYYRISSENNLNVEHKNDIKNKYQKIKSRKEFANFINLYYDNEKILKTYPNMIIQEKDNKMVYLDTLVKGVESFYYRLGKE